MPLHCPKEKEKENKILIKIKENKNCSCPKCPITPLECIT